MPTFYNERIQFQETFDSVWIVVENKKPWSDLSALLLQSIALILTTFFGIKAVDRSAEEWGSSWTTGLLVFLGVSFLVQAFRQVSQAVQSLTNREILEIDNQHVAIERTILGLQDRQEVPVEDIWQISLHPMRLKKNSTEGPALLIRHNRGLARYCTFGRAIGTPDAHKMVDLIHKRFPQYKA